MKKDTLRLIEIITGSTILFAITGYFCGYTILSSFLKNVFNLPFTAGMTLPPRDFIFLGYSIIFSFSVGIIIYWNSSIKRYLNDLVSLSFIMILSGFILKISSGYKVYNYYFSAGFIKLILFLLLLIGTFLIIFLYRKIFIEKLNKMKSIEEYLPLSVTAILCATMLPIFSNLRGAILISSYFDPISFMISFYFEFAYILTVVTVVTSKILKYFNSKKKRSNTDVYSTLFKLFIVYLVCIYSFSVTVGNAMARSYKESNISIFPSANIHFKKDAVIDNKQNIINKAGFISNDNNIYYFFLKNPNKLLLINGEIIDYIDLYK